MGSMNLHSALMYDRVILMLLAGRTRPCADGTDRPAAGPRRRLAHLFVVVPLCVMASMPVRGEQTASVTLRGHLQHLRLFGPPSGDPIVLSTGDGGWIHLGPHVADVLVAHGFYVVGFDVKAYLSSFTDGAVTLRAEDEPGDYQTLARFATGAGRTKPILIGVSEGAGLSVLAATDPGTQRLIGGVVGLGLPDINELGWRWRDAIIYITHGVPNEPSFSTASIIERISPVPLAAIHSTGDEFVPLDQFQRLFARAKDPKQAWVIKAADHRFSDNLSEFDRRLLEAISWVKANAPR